MRLFQAPVPAEDEVVLDFGSSITGFAWLLPVALTVLTLGGGIAGFAAGRPFTALWILAVGGVLGVVTLGLLRFQHLRAVLTTTRLACPRLLWGWDVLDLRSVAGVGLRFVEPLPPRVRSQSVAPARPSWQLSVWRADHYRVGIPLAVPASDLPPLPRAPDPEDLLPLAPVLAASWPGQVARMIADQVAVASAPGPSELDEHHLEASAHAEQFEKAYWSPDGRMGLLR
jgi:hypothetical protein